MSLPEDLLLMEQELLERNRAIDAKTAAVLQRVGTPAAEVAVPAQPSPPQSPPKQPPAAAKSSARKPSAEDPVAAARAVALEQELRQMTARLQAAERDRDKHAEDSAKQTKIVAALTAKIEKDKNAKEDALDKAKQADAGVLNLKREITSLKKSLKAQETNTNAKEARLQRALEDLEKVKATAQTQHGQRESADGLKEQVARLQAENKKLQAQKSELLGGFKKQAKLIDILKRQKMHIEAAKLLSFTEEEFVRTLDLGEAIG